MNRMRNTLKQITNSKLFLLTGALCAAAVDLVIIIMLAVGGGMATHYVYPAIMLALDLAYLIIGLFFTDYRFKYSLTVWISYVILYGVLTAAGLGTILGGDGVVITSAAIGLWAGVHITLTVCAIIAALCASRFVKNFWVACVFGALGVIFLIGYTAFVGVFGFYGQGTEGRPLVYSYDRAADAYTAEDVLAGRSGKVTVPETFNGKPVTAVSYKVLLNSGVRQYILPDGIDFVNEYLLSLSADVSDKTIFVGKESVNAVRERFYGTLQGNGVALANATLPDGLADGEGYVAFNYSFRAFEACGGDVIPVYVGDLQNFNLETYASNFDYVAGRDGDKIENLDRAYNNGGYILSDIAYKGGSVFGGVTESTVADVEFEKVYRVNILGGNDLKYDLREKQPDFCFDELGGTRLEYRYTTVDRANSFLAGATPRKGFNLQWVMMDGGSTEVSDLAAALENLQESQVTLVPVWSLKAPQIKLDSSAAGNRLTYGESVSLTSQVTVEADGVELSYQWGYDGNLPEIWRESGLLLERPLPAESGVYTLKVTIGGGEITSLTAEGSAQLNLTVDKKKITLDWSVPEDRVYDGNEKEVSVSYDSAQLVSGDNIALSIDGAGGSTASFTNAGAYDLAVTASGDENYELVGNTYSFTIQKRPVEVEWSGFENLTYSGKIQTPTAVAHGLSGESLVESVIGGRMNAGENYTATAVCGNGNYSFTNSGQTFSIKKAPLTVAPQTVRFTYGSTPQASAVKLICNGFVNGETETALSGRLTLSVTQTKAGTYEGGAVIGGLTSNNYDITYSAGTVIIDKLTADISVLISGWDDMVYDGNEHGLSGLWVKNQVEGDEVEVVAENLKAVNAGTHKAKAVALVGADAGNYILPDGLEFEYTIEKGEPPLTFKLNGENFDGNASVTVGDVLSWKSDTHIWGVKITVNGVELDDGGEKADVFQYSNSGSYTFEKAGDVVIEIDLGGCGSDGNDDSYLRRIIKLEIKGVTDPNAKSGTHGVVE